MNKLQATRATIAAAIFGLILAVSSAAQSQTIDAGQHPLDDAQIVSNDRKTEGPETTSKDSEALSGHLGPISDVSSPVAGVNPAESEPIGTFRGIYDALKAAKWIVALGGVLMFLVWGMRLFAGRFVPWFKTRKGGYILGLGTAVFLGIGAALFAGGELGVSLLLGIVSAEWAAAGAWERFKDVFKI